jgi:hypothetical protein
VTASRRRRAGTTITTLSAGGAQRVLWWGIRSDLHAIRLMQMVGLA